MLRDKMTDNIRDRFQEVMDRIRGAAQACGRDPESVRLVVVSKTVGADSVKEAILSGAKILGENYVQEARDKINALSLSDISWHFIGHLQTNKAKYAVRLFDLIHSVDSFKLAREIDKYAGKIAKCQPVLVQVNIAGEATKSGISEEKAVNLVKEISRLENLSIKGLMTMPPFFNAPDRVRPFFAALKVLSGLIRAEQIPNVEMAELSMGMTGDFEVAIEEGATLVRVGTAIFGERS
ncbi:Pyridoxal phosphate-containing protein YggS [Olavius algarvensis associated proteobacterium Delta 3]|nr:Pyridoxal phosphate-containing protein YggS [Olavius algarvensis associated proteobacterium Delta 3]